MKKITEFLGNPSVQQRLGYNFMHLTNAKLSEFERASKSTAWCPLELFRPEIYLRFTTYTVFVLLPKGKIAFNYLGEEIPMPIDYV